jgi:hypothetical protein
VWLDPVETHILSLVYAGFIAAIEKPAPAAPKAAADHRGLRWARSRPTTSDLVRRVRHDRRPQLDGAGHVVRRPGRHPVPAGTNTARPAVRVAGLEDVQLDEAGFWQSGTAAVDPSRSPRWAARRSRSPTRTTASSPRPPTSTGSGRSTTSCSARSARCPVPADRPVGARHRPRLGRRVRGRVLKTKANVARPARPAPRSSSAPSPPASSCTRSSTSSPSAPRSPRSRVGAGQHVRRGDDPDDVRPDHRPIGGTWGTRVAGPITDPWYRLRVTAITGTHTIACVAGIR